MIGDKLGMNAHYAPLHPVRCLDETNCSSLRGGAFCQGPKVQREKAMNIANVVRHVLQRNISKMKNSCAADARITGKREEPVHGEMRDRQDR